LNNALGGTFPAAQLPGFYHILSMHYTICCDVRGVSKTFGEWCQKTNKREDKNKLTLLAFKIFAILHNVPLATFINLLETVSKGLFKNQSQNRTAVTGSWIAAMSVKRAPFMMLFRQGNRKKSTVFS
jgi:hypothetical protein